MLSLSKKAVKDGALIVKVIDVNILLVDVKSGGAAKIGGLPVGRWRKTEGGAAFCTACKTKMNGYLFGYGCCPMCGARMKGANND